MNKEIHNFEISGVTLLPSKRESICKFKLPSQDYEEIKIFMDKLMPNGELKVSSKARIKLDSISFNEFREVEISISGNVINPVLKIFIEGIKDYFELTSNNVLESENTYLICTFNKSIGQIFYNFVKGSNKKNDKELAEILDKNSDNYIIGISKVIFNHRDRSEEIIQYAASQFLEKYKQGKIKLKYL